MVNKSILTKSICQYISFLSLLSKEFGRYPQKVPSGLVHGDKITLVYSWVKWRLRAKFQGEWLSMVDLYRQAYAHTLRYFIYDLIYT
jgi:hypothetical protein